MMNTIPGGAGSISLTMFSYAADMFVRKLKKAPEKKA
jgi:hypothetical protein